MDVSRWDTLATFFPWPHVQRYLDDIDATVYQAAIEFAQEQLLSEAKACSQCGLPADELFWLSVTDPEPAWDAGTGRVGFLTVCKQCRLQVDFLVDCELTEMQADQWRECRTLS
jgi:hypothetical protein